uniref:PDZ domain-containing protein n=1 Tax=Arion vulgaris TaxID=1028688 RepID=A0A0B7BBV1_9EUPU
MMERKFAKLFIILVKELIHDDAEKETLFECLRTYQSNQDLHRLLSELRVLLNEPNKLELYDVMRPLILLQHQIEYSRRAPATPGVKLRTVRLIHHSGESLGFAVRGGFEHRVGIFVTEVAPGSQAYRQGLRVGDEVVRVNGFTISEAIHEDVLNLIKSKDDIVLKVTYIGMLPVKDHANEPVTWKYVDDLDDDLDQEGKQKKMHSPDIKIFIDSTGHASLGCSILSESGPAATYPGIFVEKVRPGSIADQVGLEPGDQIMEVNETSFRKITWEQAVLALKSSRQLSVVIRKKAGSRLIQKLSSNLAAIYSERQTLLP